MGVLRDDHGRVLVQRRVGHMSAAGLWEFPGGKVEPGESAARALQRELQEELAIDSLPGASLISLPWDYAPGPQRLLIRAMEVRRWSGQPRPVEGQELAWLYPEQLGGLDWWAANRPILSALQLPAYYLITPNEPADPQAWLERVCATFTQPGVGMIQMRRHDLDDESFIHLASQLFARCKEYGVRMLVNCDLRLAARVAADGVHLSAERLGEPGIESQLSHGQYGLVGASCHSLAALHSAAALGADFALLSPVRWTASHPDRQPMGWGSFAALTAQAQLPVYALGGLDGGDLHTAQGHGAQGVAAIRGLLP